MKVIISKYKENLDWLKEYNLDYLIYNKGDPVDDPRTINVENIGGNQKDIFKFICDNYDNLPGIMMFIQAYPFDHCPKEFFDILITNTAFTSLEYHGFAKNNYE